MGGKQLGFSDYELTAVKKQAKRERFLSEMEAVVPWQALIALTKPRYPKVSKKGGPASVPIGIDVANPLGTAVVFAKRSGDGRGFDRGVYPGPVRGLSQ
jgi:hypothetical protein